VRSFVPERRRRAPETQGVHPGPALEEPGNLPDRVRNVSGPFREPMGLYGSARRLHARRKQGGSALRPRGRLMRGPPPPARLRRPETRLLDQLRRPAFRCYLSEIDPAQNYGPLEQFLGGRPAACPAATPGTGTCTGTIFRRGQRRPSGTSAVRETAHTVLSGGQSTMRRLYFPDQRQVVRQKTTIGRRRLRRFAPAAATGRVLLRFVKRRLAHARGRPVNGAAMSLIAERTEVFSSRMWRSGAAKTPQSLNARVQSEVFPARPARLSTVMVQSCEQTRTGAEPLPTLPLFTRRQLRRVFPAT